MLNYLRLHLRQSVRALFAIAGSLLLASLLTACGGGGGGGDGGSPSSAPYILASVISFPSGAVPTGFTSSNYNSQVSVDVRTSSSNSSAPISNATVTVNGVPFVYSNTYQDYWRNMDIAPGQAVTVSVTVNGTTYTVMGNQAVSYPSINNPQTGANWYVNTSNTLSWTGPLSGTNSAYVLGVADSSLNLLWPSSNSFQVVSSSTNSYPISAYALPTGIATVMVGAAQVFTIPNAAANSALVLEGFNTTAVNVSENAPPSLVSMTLTPTNGVMSQGRSRQLTATGTYSDSTTQDITSQVTWQSADTSKITINSNGLATAVGAVAGNVSVSASLGSVQASTSINLFVPTPSPSLPLDHAVSFQMDYAHTGHAVFSSPLSFPTQAAWSITFGDNVSFPLVADGKVFVTTGMGGGYGSKLYAIDQATGAIAWGPINMSGLYFRSGIAYSRGKLFVVNYDGQVRTYDAATGTAGWTTLLNYFSVNEPPVVADGIVYVSGYSRIAALDESNGNILWSNGVTMWGNSAPTVADGGVFVSCIYKFDPVMGTQLWANTSGCNALGGRTSAYSNGQIYTPSFGNSGNPLGFIFNSTTGALTSTVNTDFIPAFLGNVGFFYSSGSLRAIDSTSHATLWSFTPSGDTMSTPPLVINQTVFFGGTSGTVYGVDAATGALQWSGTAGIGILSPDEWNASAPLVGLGAGAGYLVVPAINKLTAWRLN